MGIRKDLFADNQFSGYLQKGEYIIGLTHDSEEEHTYRMRYAENFLEPLYIYEVDKVPLIKIWKNDKKYIKKEIAKLKEKTLQLFPEKIDNSLQWNLPNSTVVTGIEIDFKKNDSCKDITSAYLQISSDGNNWDILPETYPGEVIDVLGEQPKNNQFIAPVARSEISYIALSIEPKDACIFNVENSEIMTLTD